MLIVWDCRSVLSRLPKHRPSLTNDFCTGTFDCGNLHEKTLSDAVKHKLEIIQVLKTLWSKRLKPEDRFDLTVFRPHDTYWSFQSINCEGARSVDVCYPTACPSIYCSLLLLYLALKQLLRPQLPRMVRMTAEMYSEVCDRCTTDYITDSKSQVSCTHSNIPS